MGLKEATMLPRTRRSLLTVLILLSVPTVTPRCTPAFADAGRSKATIGTPAPTLGALPATYIGLLPCADCAGIRYQINFLPDGAYMQRMTHLLDAHDDSHYELGAWSLSHDGR